MTEETPKTALETFEGMSPEELLGTAEAWGVPVEKVRAAIIAVLVESDVYKQGMAQGCEGEV